MKFVDKIDEFFEQVWLWLEQHDNKHNKGENSETKSS